MEERKKEEKSEKEKRIRAITKLYYSNPKIQEFLVKFGQNREVVPRDFEGFGKRPDGLQYPSDIMGFVNNGATSFHCSEEIWNDPLQINSDMGKDEMNNSRKSWDLLIDIDSPFLDCSKIAAKLIIAALENHGIKNYGIKFSGSKGMHIIVSSRAFPEEFNGIRTKEMFPEWPRAISEYLMNYIRKDYNKRAAEILTDFSAIERRTKIKKEELTEEVHCNLCNNVAMMGMLIKYKCPVCGLEAERKNAKVTKRRLRCLNSGCAGVLEVEKQDDYWYCEYDKDPENANIQLDSIRHPGSFEKVKGVSAEKIAALDLVLVAPRHLFRMPYSLHEKTALSSVVLNKEEIDKFSPRDANPLNVKIREYYPDNEEGEARKLLASALEWKKNKEKVEESVEKKYEKMSNYEKIEIKDVKEEMFPGAIKKLLLGLSDGKKRGLFILITFLRSCNFSPEYIIERIREWNKLNKPPLKEGYIKSQIDWHFKQKKKILPPNYNNDAFYKDLGLLDKKPETKNPIVDVMRKMRK